MTSRNSRFSVTAIAIAILSVVLTTFALSIVLYFNNDYVIVLVVKERGSLPSITTPGWAVDGLLVDADDTRDDTSTAIRRRRQQEQEQAQEQEQEPAKTKKPLSNKEIRDRRRKKRQQRIMARNQERVRTGRESYRIVCIGDENVIFLPSPASAADDGSTNDDNKDGITGSQILMRGSVYRSEEVPVENDEIVGTISNIPPPTPGSIFTQKCTATRAVADFNVWPIEAQVQETMCDYNFCLEGDRGCLFLKSGGPYVFDPFDTDPQAVPMVEMVIMGGTGNSSGFYGGARMTTLVRSNNNDDNDNSQGVAVLQVDLFYQKIYDQNIPKYKLSEEATGDEGILET